MHIHGKLVDIHNKAIFPATVTVEGGRIVKIERNSHRGPHFILPGFVDAHVHIESSLLPPSEFARMAVRHGSVGCVCDSSGISQILGKEGVNFLLENASKTPFKFLFNPKELPLKKCATLSEARQRHSQKIKVLIGTEHFNTLFPLLEQDPDQCLLSTGHLTADRLLLGHINLLVKRAIQRGMEPIDAISAATKTPTLHHNLNVGLLREGDPADFILVDSLENLRVLETYLGGTLVFKKEPLLSRPPLQPILGFHCKPLKISDLTERNCNPETNELKMVKIPRDGKRKPSIDLIPNIGLKRGALGASTFHDIVAVSKTDRDLVDAANAVILANGGIAISYEGKTDFLSLPIGGIMTTVTGEETANRYSELVLAARAIGCEDLSAFFALLS